MMMTTLGSRVNEEGGYSYVSEQAMTSSYLTHMAAK
jgi:hypothetical protein